MIAKEEEKSRVNNSQVRELERTLDKIELEKEKLVKEFNENLNTILGPDFLSRLNTATTIDENGNTVSLLAYIGEKSVGSTDTLSLLTSLHKSMITDSSLKHEYEDRLKKWFSEKSRTLRNYLDKKDTSSEVNKYVSYAYALSSLAITAFHKRPNMNIRDVQVLAGIAISNGDIAELGTGEGKTISAILPTYLHALRGKGVHVVTANSYLSKRDYEEVLPIFEGLGLSIGFVAESIEDLARIEGMNPDTMPLDKKIELEKKLQKMKKISYRADITYGSKSAIAFDYLRDGIATQKEALVQREEAPGFALIDEVDDALIDDAQSPYVLGDQLSVYKNGMNLIELSNAIGKPFEEVKNKIRSAGINIGTYEKLDYEKARNIAVSLYSKELVPDSLSYQKRAQRFFEKNISSKMYVVGDNNEFGVNPEELYQILTGADKRLFNSDKRRQELIDARIKEIKENSPIIYYPAKKEYKVLDKCYQEFLDYCYSAFQIRSVTRENEQSIIRDSSYKEKVDYNIVNGSVVLTLQGTNKIIRDSKHPEFMNDYNMYINLVNPFSGEILHYLDQALVANLVMRNLEDYKVDNGVVKVVKNGRVVDGSNYTNGLHQALEFKEKIPEGNITRETHSLASITQKDFYGRYDVFSGMTGTSSKNIFQDIFDKRTISIPRNPFYQFYSKRLKRKGKTSNNEPLGIEKKDTKFASDTNSKIKLIVDSIKNSHKTTPKQPVLLVVSNPEEIQLLSDALRREGIKHTTLSVLTDKSKEAEIIAKAGLPGAVTISTEMAGRGTDVKLGGDRNTLIDIATEYHIKKTEEKYKQPLVLTPAEREQVTKKVELALMQKTDSQGRRTFLWSEKEEKNNNAMLQSIGLKVISSGFFNVDRIDRQLEGRCGRNGAKGVTERFASPSDLEHIGVHDIKFGSTVAEYFDGYPKNPDGSINFDNKALNKMNEKIKFVQSNNESSIGVNIMVTQELSKNATKVTEKYREERRKILCEDVDIDSKIQGMFEDTIDSLLTSYMTSKEIPSYYTTVSDIVSESEQLDLEAFSLEVKELLGVNIDMVSVMNSGTNLFELRESLLDYVMSEREKQKKNDPLAQSRKDTDALLTANNYALANIPNILDTSSTQRNLTAMSMGMEGQENYYANQEFYRGLMSMKLEASKTATKQLIGKPLTLEERKTLNDIKDDIFGAKPIFDEFDSSYELSNPISIENDFESVEAFREERQTLKKKDEKKIKKIEKKSEKYLRDGKEEDISKLYSNLKIRPMKFISSIYSMDGKLVLTRKNPLLSKETVSKGTSLH